MATELYADTDERPSLLLVIVDALAFWVRSPVLFWIVALPIAGLAAAATYAVEANQSLAEFRNHWGWTFLFALIYAQFLDRWMKAILLEGASNCEEVDNLRRSMISPRFLGLATALFLLAMAMGLISTEYVEANVVIWSAAVAVFALYLPSLSAAEPMSLRKAFVLGRSVQLPLFMLIAGSVAISLLADFGIARAATDWWPDKPWRPATVAAAHRVIDCLLLAIVGHVLASLFRTLTDWRQPEPDDHPYRDLARGRPLSRVKSPRG
jgi:hypothetical protein